MKVKSVIAGKDIMPNFYLRDATAAVLRLHIYTFTYFNVLGGKRIIVLYLKLKGHGLRKKRKKLKGHGLDATGSTV